MLISLLVILASSFGVLLAGIFSRPTDQNPSVGISVCVPLLLIGILSTLLLTSQGKPLIEWLLPLLITVFVANMRRSSRTIRVVAVIETGLAAAGVLCFLQLVVVDDVYVVVNDSMLSREKTMENTRLWGLQKTLDKELKPGVTYPPQDVFELLPTIDPKYLAHREYTPEWHTWFTRLSRVHVKEHQIWFIGGVIQENNRQLYLEYR